VFNPGFAFTTSTSGWENLSDEGGIFGLDWITHPGDTIRFFRQPDPTRADGAPAGIAIEVGAIQRWLVSDPDLTVGPVTKVIVGGLSGVMLDLAIAPTSTSHPGDCLVKACASVFRGRGANWIWDWGTSSSERQRLYLLTAKDGVVAIFVDSWDGTTFDALTKEADPIVASLRFDQS